jgi:FkbM family methyltransferase
LINKIGKMILSSFAYLVKHSPSALKFLFTHALKDEIINFYDNYFFLGYTHIEKAIMLAKEFNLLSNIIVDVGGADGTTSKIFSGAFPNNKIYVFEPLKANYLQIEQLIIQFPNIILIKKAVGSSLGKAIIHKAKRITSSSLYKMNVDTHSEMFSDILKVNSEEEVTITTLNESLPKDKPISIIKIDVQGYELEVLKGADSVLKRTSIIVLEVNNHDYYVGSPKYYDIDQYLRNKNFILYDIFPSTKDKGQLKEWDSVYVRKDHLK